MARPNEYNQTVATEICRRLIEGQSLRSICKDADMPCIATVLNWRNANPEFLAQYARAREDQADTLADEIIHIADNCEDVNKARLMVDSRKWVASKLKSKAYGDKTETLHVGDKDRPIMISPVDANI